MFFEAIVIGLAIGFLREGRLTNIQEINFRGWYLIIIALLLQISPTVFAKFNVLENSYNYIVFGASLLMLLGLLINLDKRGFWIIAIGALMNLIVIGLNGFAMPVHLSVLEGAGLGNFGQSIADGSVLNYVGFENFENILNYLGKFIVIPKPYPVPRIISIGDILISLGLLRFVQGEMNRPFFVRGSKMIQYSYKAGRK